MSLYREANLRHAGIAILGGGFVVGTIAGKLLERAICPTEPSVARFSFVATSVAVVLLDLVYRYFHRAAAESEGWGRFLNPAAGGRVVIFPAWLVGVALLVYALVTTHEAGFCS
jgi:hypothetical protein